MALYTTKISYGAVDLPPFAIRRRNLKKLRNSRFRYSVRVIRLVEGSFL